MGFQKTFKLPYSSKGCHLVSREVQSQIGKELAGIKVRFCQLFSREAQILRQTDLLEISEQFGMLFLSIKHTSAALTLYASFLTSV